MILSYNSYGELRVSLNQKTYTYYNVPQYVFYKVRALLNHSNMTAIKILKPYRGKE